MKLRSKAFKAAFNSLAAALDDPRDLLPLMCLLTELGHLQPRLTSTEVQALCTAVWRCDVQSITPRTRYSRLLAARLNAELDAAEATLAGRPVAAHFEIQKLRRLAKNIQRLREIEAALLYLAAMFLQLAPSGSPVTDFFRLKKSNQR